MASDFPVSATSIVHSLSELLIHQENDEIVELLISATPFIEETDYDNWNGGTYFYTLVLKVPIASFALIEGNVPSIKGIILGKIKSILRDTGSQVLNTVVIKPMLITDGERPEDVSKLEASRIWGPGILRVFLSHISTQKDFVSALKAELLEYGIASFVAHQDIEPTTEWQVEIDTGHNSMESLNPYLSVSIVDLKEAHNRCHPREREAG
jgi:hypothetical protein